MTVILSWSALVLAALPMLMVLRNLGLYRPPSDAETTAGADAAVSVLIPARDEAANIVGAVGAALAAADGVARVEVVVLDDGSTDATADLVRTLSQGDPRVRLETAPPLPEGWNGKQHACMVLAERAADGFGTLVFVDADVRLKQGALARLAGARRTSGVDLISGVPRQVMGTWLERLIVPQILLVLLGYLPIGRMRVDDRPSLGVGCGQLFVTDRSAYTRAGGHQTIRSSLHDGVELPRAFRARGFKTDLVDVTGLATCRMYNNASDTWRGFLKNAGQGMGSPRGIVPWSVLLLGGHVLPWVLLIGGMCAWPVLVAAGFSAFTSAAIAMRFGQGAGAVVTRPLGVATLVAVQWTALVGRMLGWRARWRGRAC